MGDDIEFSFDETFELDSDHAISRSNSFKLKKTDSQRRREKEKRRSKLWYEKTTNSAAQSDSEASTGAQETIPTAIVIKNIPFSIKRDALLTTLNNLDIPKPYAFNYHFDNGVFRGLAFANYRTPEDTDLVVSALNGYEVAGRKLRVEYKRVLPAAEREAKEREKLEKQQKAEKEKVDQEPSLTIRTTEVDLLDKLKPEKSDNGKQEKDNKRDSSIRSPVPEQLDLNDPETLKFYDQVLIFRDDKSREELVFSKTLSSAHRRTLHLIAQKLSLYYYNEGEGEDRILKIVRKPASAAINIKQTPRNGSFGRRSAAQLLVNLSESPSNRSMRGDASPLSRSPFRKSWLTEGPMIFPIRQPRGPDPTQNFAYRPSRLHVSSIPFSVTDDDVTTNYSENRRSGLFDVQTFQPPITS